MEISPIQISFGYCFAPSILHSVAHPPVTHPTVKDVQMYRVRVLNPVKYNSTDAVRSSEYRVNAFVLLLNMVSMIKKGSER